MGVLQIGITCVVASRVPFRGSADTGDGLLDGQADHQ